MDAKEETKKVFLTEPIKILIGSILASVCTFIFSLLRPFQNWLATKLSFSQLLAITGACLSGLILTITYIFYLRKKLKENTPKLFYKFGIQWDDEQNPYCPTCSSRLAPYKEYQWQGWGCSCFVCKRIFSITKDDGSGKRLSFKEAVEIISKAKQT